MGRTCVTLATDECSVWPRAYVQVYRPCWSLKTGPRSPLGITTGLAFWSFFPLSGCQLGLLIVWSVILTCDFCSSSLMVSKIHMRFSNLGFVSIISKLLIFSVDGKPERKRGLKKATRGREAEEMRNKPELLSDFPWVPAKINIFNHTLIPWRTELPLSTLADKRIPEKCPLHQNMIASSPDREAWVRQMMGCRARFGWHLHTGAEKG